RFRPVRLDHPRLRVYLLAGQRTLLAWCRDSQNTWQAELAQSKVPESLQDQVIALPKDMASRRTASVRIYDPWTNVWLQGKLEDGRLALPPFRRSIVFRIDWK
ncbi:MAG: hypothetical protein MUC88_29530, partial [Planctomycetes bacterium]|nr:hypothetical protein [Planctomycetota bacterium]